MPVAGLGTRFLPATKAIPKEMLPLVDTPEHPADRRGVRRGRHRGDHLRHRARQVGDRGSLRSRGRAREPAREARQDRRSGARAPADRDGALRLGAPGEARGLGHAVLCAREAVGDEPFAVVLGDDLLDAEVSGVRQLIDVYEKTGTGVIALKEVPAGQEHMYGIVDGEPAGPRQLEDPQAGREARARDGAVAHGDHRPLRAAARDLPDPRRRPSRARAARSS